LVGSGGNDGHDKNSGHLFCDVILVASNKFLEKMKKTDIEKAKEYKEQGVGKRELGE